MLTKRQHSRICRQAADEIQTRGLLKGGFGDVDGPKCAVGALRFVHGGSTHRPVTQDGEPDQITPLFKSVRPRSPRAGLMEFSDAARTRKHDVVSVLRDMAARAAAGEEIA